MVMDTDREWTETKDKMDRYHIDMIDKMKNYSSTHLDPARAANWAMGGELAKVRLTLETLEEDLIAVK